MRRLVRRATAVAAVLVGLALATAPAHAQKTEIHFWHALTGQLGEALEAQAK